MFQLPPTPADSSKLFSLPERPFSPRSSLTWASYEANLLPRRYLPAEPDETMRGVIRHRLKRCWQIVCFPSFTMSPISGHASLLLPLSPHAPRAYSKRPIRAGCSREEFAGYRTEIESRLLCLTQRPMEVNAQSADIVKAHFYFQLYRCSEI